MIRLFVAIELPEDLRRRVAMLASGIRAARWVAEESLHITVRFIGEVNEDAMHEIVPALEDVRSAPFAVTLAGAGHFETGGRVHTLWLGVEKNGALGALRDRVESTLVRAGLDPERRSYSPHLTVGRMNNGQAADVHPWLAANTLFRAPPFAVARFVLYSSWSSRSSPIYRPEAMFPLARD